MAVLNDEKIKSIFKTLEQGVRDVFTSERYLQYLSVMAKFHNYSFRNTLLILMQNPNATHVAGYRAWQTKFHRQVRRGEEAITILGYTPSKITVQVPKLDSDGQQIVDSSGKAITESTTKIIPSFTPLNVFDISQTEGEPLPSLAQELRGSVKDYQLLLQAIHQVSPFKIVYEDIQGAAFGYCSPTEQKIAIQSGLSDAQTIKTAIHELTHANLHSNTGNIVSDTKSRETKEVEAESTAFIVCNRYGIDTSNYSFEYIAAWSSDKEVTALKASLNTIQSQASDLISKIDAQLELIRAEQERKNVSEVDISVLRSGATHTDDTCNCIAQSGFRWFALDHSQNIEVFSTREAAIDWVNERINERNNNKVESLFDRTAALAKKFDDFVRKFSRPDTQKVPPFDSEDPAKRLTLLQKLIFANDVKSLMDICQLTIGNISASPGLEELVCLAARELSSIESNCRDIQLDILRAEVDKVKGVPVVCIRQSESLSLKEGKIIPLHKANQLFQSLDTNNSNKQVCCNTAFYLAFKLGQDYRIYEGYQDIGNRTGSLINHIRTTWEDVLQPEQMQQCVASGNENHIKNAYYITNKIIPYLNIHTNLSELEESTQAILASPAFSSNEHSYLLAVLSYISQCRVVLNNDSYNFPTPPKRSDFGLISIPQSNLPSEFQSAYTKLLPTIQSAHSSHEINYLSDTLERTFTIYQLRNDPKNEDLCFRDLSTLHKKNIEVTLSRYDKVYHGNLPKGKTLEDIFVQFNTDIPSDFHGHSLSVSDIVAIEYQGICSANYVDSTGFKSLPAISKEIMLQRSERATDKNKQIKTYQNDLSSEKNEPKHEPNDTSTHGRRLPMRERLISAKAEVHRRQQVPSASQKGEIAHA